MLDKLKEVPDEQKAKDILKNEQDNFGQWVHVLVLVEFPVTD